ncbi:MAG: MarR family winged helix-turn-helix transcriptional regulator [Acidimicrobiales bacterium]
MVAKEPAPRPGEGWLSEQEQAAWRGLLRMSERLTSVLNRQLLADAGLSGQDYAVLVVLSEAPDGHLRPVEMGSTLEWEKSRLSHHLSRMAERGLVTKAKCDTDQRGAYVSITDEGRRAIEAAAPAHVRAVRSVFIELLTRAQLQALTEIADAILKRPGPEPCDSSSEA